jgi:hypothetical protein
VVIPIRNRGGQRLRNSLAGLAWQSAGPPVEVVLVSQGSRADVDRELAEICAAQGARLITTGSPSQPWNKSLALNTGIRSTHPDVPFVMTMDADMILAPNFLETVLNRLQSQPPALVLCRISDLPSNANLPAEPEALKAVFERLLLSTRLRRSTGSGGIQAARRSFFFHIRGYDEDLLWWGAMDGDILIRARLLGLELAWIEHSTAMLHQWHPRKHQTLADPLEIEQARRHWLRNHELVRQRAHNALRNPHGWGGEP